MVYRVCILHKNIMGQDLDYNKHRKLIFGPYIKSHEDHKITNNMEEQTVSGICLGYKKISLKTGCVVTRKQKI